MEQEITKQLDLFNFLLEPRMIKKPIRLIELFAGIGAQHKALSVLGVPFESYKIVEWAFNSIVAYNSIHIKDFADYSKGKTKEEMLERIKGISTNYDEPLSDKQLNAKPIEWIERAYNNVIATHDLVNIMEVKGEDLEIVDTDKYDYIMTYSFPCQDLSLAGNRGGMSVSQADGGTRSGLLWEVERILDELYKGKKPMPQILLMENVPQVLSQNTIQDFQKWRAKLESLGYSNYVEILNAKHYGIPQNRQRCFMISILGEYSYEFPIRLPLKYRLKDMLEKQVNEKYYLSDKMIKYITADNEKWTGNNDKSVVNKSIGSTINTREGSRRCDASNYVSDILPEDTDIKDIQYIGTTNGHQSGNVYGSNGIGPTLTACDYKSPPKVIEREENNGMLIKNATKKGYIVAKNGDGIDISSRMETHRGTVQDGMAQTITTKGGENVGVIVEEETLKRELCNKLIQDDLVEENDIVKHSYTAQILNGNKKAVEKSNEMITLTTRGDCIGVVVKDELEPKVLGGIGEKKSNNGTQYYEQNRIYDDKVATSIPASCSFHPYYQNNLRIRKLTPKECMRLMGFEDKDYDAMKKAKLTDSAIYHCAGDSIVVSVLVSLLSQMINGIDNHIKLVNDYVDKIIEQEPKVARKG